MRKQRHNYKWHRVKRNNIITHHEMYYKDSRYLYTYAQIKFSNNQYEMVGFDIYCKSLKDAKRKTEKYFNGLMNSIPKDFI